MNWKLFTLAASFFAALYSSASAQNALSSGVFDTMSSAEAIQLMQSNGLSARLVNQTEKNEAIEVTTPNGNVFYLGMRNCASTFGVLRCKLIQPTALFNATGVTLAMANELHKSKLILAYVTLDQSNRGTIFSKIILSGGVTANNVLEELSRYLRDVEVLMQSISPGSASQISYEPNDAIVASTGMLLPDVSKHLASAEELVINPAGANAKPFLTEELKAYLD